MNTDESDESTVREKPEGYALQWVEGIRPDDANETDETVEDDQRRFAVIRSLF